MSSEHIAIHLHQRPETFIVPGETFAVQKHTTPTSAELQDGDVVFESLYLSLDPAMRGWLDDCPSYLPPVAIGEIMRGHALGRVTASRSEKFPVGSFAVGITNWTEQSIVNESSLEAVPTPNPADGGHLTDALGVLGMTGITAYWGMVEVGHVKAGDIVVVSGAAGATGSIAGQIAKIHGATVYGIAGSDDKCRWLVDELKFDGALNYKSEDFAEKFKSLTQGKIDLFYDNVGGEVLDLALLCANKNARFVMCGGVSQYNENEVKGPKNYMMIWKMRIRMEGFLVFDHMDKTPEVRRKLSQWLAEGRLQRRETIISWRPNGVSSDLLQATDQPEPSTTQRPNGVSSDLLQATDQPEPSTAQRPNGVSSDLLHALVQATGILSGSATHPIKSTSDQSGPTFSTNIATLSARKVASGPNEATSSIENPTS
ncbi:Alcohol dehydrogenase, C-terminal [Penicillium italicum]|uniref:Alcohol dehydrogenase, C-terminal n=1 Tax=Penicillium italicum TaxID=40296 RepID=A0A0A2L3A0_PENIT|nr:Alcohol dehydrogenase, C-terminal [Penicillium italicum]